MANNQKIIQGTITEFTFEKEATKYFRLVFPEGGWCFCKGKRSKGRELHIGQKLKLYGEWKVNPNPQYSHLGKQFYFSDYKIISTFEPIEQISKKPNSFGISISQKSKQEVVTGHILKFTNFKGNSRIFLLRTDDRQEFHCVGNLIEGKDIFEDYNVRLYGEWRINKNRPYMGTQFYYGKYEIIPKDKPLKVIRRKNTSKTDITSFLKRIGAIEISYDYPKHDLNTIAVHVKKQLQDRVINATDDERDFYFLTALFDRRVKDNDVQKFRMSFPDLKEKLMNCWIEAGHGLSVATDNIRDTVNNLSIIENLEQNSTSFKNLKNNVPGEYGLNQLLLCLKIVDDFFERDMNKHISEYLKTLQDEESVRNKLRDDKRLYYGVGPKLASWAITNVTGHWFVVDANIKKVIEEDLKNTIPIGFDVSSDNADQILEHWFGKWSKEKYCFDKFSQDTYEEIFSDFEKEHYEYLPFIVTQYLWFYGTFVK